MNPTTHNPKRPWPVVLTATLIVVLLGALLWTAINRYFEHVIFFQTWCAHYGENSLGWKYRYIVQKRKDGGQKLINGRVSVVYEFDSLLGWHIIPSYYTHEFCEQKEFRSTDQGFRNTGPAPDSPSATILFLGDSFTEGSEVSDPHSFPYMIQHDLPGVRIINAGVGGYGHDQMLLYLERILESGIKPTHVVLGYLQTDKSRNVLWFRDYAKPHFTMHDNQLTLHTAHIMPAKSLLKHYRYIPPVYMALDVLLHGKPEQNADTMTVVLLNRINTFCQNRGIRFLMWHIPMPDDIHADVTYQDNLAHFNWLTTQLKMNNTYNPGAWMLQHRENLLKKDGHWDSTGNKLLARYFIDSIYHAL